MNLTAAETVAAPSVPCLGCGCDLDINTLDQLCRGCRWEKQAEAAQGE